MQYSRRIPKNIFSWGCNIYVYDISTSIANNGDMVNYSSRQIYEQGGKTIGGMTHEY